MEIIKEGVAEIRGKLDSYREMRQVSEVVNLQKEVMLKIQNAYKVQQVVSYPIDRVQLDQKQADRWGGGVYKHDCEPEWRVLLIWLSDH